MRRRLAGLLAFALSFVLFAGLVGYLLYAETLAPPPAAAQIAVVVYGEEAERWKALEAGVGKACGEWGIEKPVLLLSGQEDPAEQKRQIESAVAGGAQGLLVAACHSAEMQGYLEGLALPVVMVESGAGDALETVRADDRAMGRALAEALEGEEGLVCVPAPPFARQSVAARHDGFMQAAAELGLHVEALPGAQERRALAAGLAEKKPAALVLLDNEGTELAIEAAGAAMIELRLLGVGSSDKTLYAVDTGQVSRLCFADEYAAGYMAVGRLAARMGLRGGVGAQAEPVPFVLVNRENMFTPAMEELLFPVV